MKGVAKEIVATERERVKILLKFQRGFNGCRIQHWFCIEVSFPFT